MTVKQSRFQQLAVSFLAAVPLQQPKELLQLCASKRKTAAGERRASAKTSVLAKRRDSSVMETAETHRCPEMEVSELKLSLDLGERDRGEVQREKEENVMEPETHWNRWKREIYPP
jgi:hypothetical protein